MKWERTQLESYLDQALAQGQLVVSMPTLALARSLRFALYRAKGDRALVIELNRETNQLTLKRRVSLSELLP